MDRAAATQGLDIVASDDAWCIARNGHVFVVVLEGEITDAVAEAWQKTAELDLEAHGHPSFGVVVALRALSRTTLGNRVRTAAFTRRRAKVMKKIVMVTDVHAGVVISGVLRVAAIDNVHFIDESQAVRVLASLRAGIDPFL